MNIESLTITGLPGNDDQVLASLRAGGMSQRDIECMSLGIVAFLQTILSHAPEGANAVRLDVLATKAAPGHSH